MDKMQTEKEDTDRDERRRWKEKKQTEASILHEARYLDCEALSSLLGTYSNANLKIRTVPSLDKLGYPTNTRIILNSRSTFTGKFTIIRYFNFDLLPSRLGTPRNPY